MSRQEIIFTGMQERNGAPVIPDGMQVNIAFRSPEEKSLPLPLPVIACMHYVWMGSVYTQHYVI
jgi:hypothetical protein